MSLIFPTHLQHQDILTLDRRRQGPAGWFLWEGASDFFLVYI